MKSINAPNPPSNPSGTGLQGALQGTLAGALVPGATTQLRSGGPQMTIIAVNGDMIVCVWFVDEKTHCMAPFQRCELMQRSTA